MSYNLFKKFPSALGKWVSGLLGALKQCGLLAYNQPELDKVGAETRPAIMPETVIGDGVTYLEATGYTDADLGNKFTIKCKFKIEDFLLDGVYGFDQAGSDSFYLQTRDIVGDFILAVWGTTKFISSSLIAGDIAETSLVVDGASFELFINGLSLTTGTFTKSISNKSLQLLTKGVATDVSNHSIIGFSIECYDTNTTYTLATNNGKYQLVPSDPSVDPIQVTQTFAPVIPTEVNVTEVSMFDQDGYTVADGATHYKDQAMTTLYDTGDIIPNFTGTGTSIAWVDGVHPQGEYNGRVKINRRVVDGLYPPYESFYEQGTFGGTGGPIASTNKIRSIEFINVLPNTQYKVNLNGTYGCRIVEYNSDETNNIRSASLMNEGTITTRSVTTKIKLIIFDTDYDTGVDITPSDAVDANLVVFKGLTRPTSGQFVSGNSIILSDLYGHMFSTDDEGINTDRVTITNKLIPYDDMVNINNNQQYVSEDKQKILWFEEPLTGDCDHKARRFVDINEQYQVQTTESSGVYEPYSADGEELWVLKEGVKIDV